LEKLTSYLVGGIIHYEVTISGCSVDLHSGVFGGAVHEPLIDLHHLFGKLVETDGKIMIPHIDDNVSPLTSMQNKP